MAHTLGILISSFTLVPRVLLIGEALLGRPLLDRGMVDVLHDDARASISVSSLCWSRELSSYRGIATPYRMSFVAAFPCNFFMPHFSHISACTQLQPNHSTSIQPHFRDEPLAPFTISIFSLTSVTSPSLQSPSTSSATWLRWRAARSSRL